MVGAGDPFYLKFWVNRHLLKENRRQSCKAFIGLSVQKWLVGTSLSTRNFGSVTALERNRRFSTYFRS